MRDARPLRSAGPRDASFELARWRGGRARYEIRFGVWCFPGAIPVPITFRQPDLNEAAAAAADRPFVDASV